MVSVGAEVVAGGVDRLELVAGGVAGGRVHRGAAPTERVEPGDEGSVVFETARSEKRERI